MKIALMDLEERLAWGPLVLLRPQWRLRCGGETLRRRTERVFGQSVDRYLPAPGLSPVLDVTEEAMSPGEIPELILSGLSVVGEELPAQLLDLAGGPTVMLQDDHDRFVGVWLAESDRHGVTSVRDHVLGLLATAPRETVDARVLDTPWSAVDLGTRILIDEVPARVSHGGWHKASAVNHRSCTVIGDVWLGAGAVIGPGVVLDGRQGPVVVGDDTLIGAGAVIEGPVFLDQRSEIRPRALIHGGTDAGPVCCLGGEVEASTVLGYSDKPYDGFLGHSYVGEWVSLGAGTNIGDSRHEDATVRIDWAGHEIETGNPSWGLLMGDHSKTAVGCNLPTGAVVGISANLFNPVVARTVPNFSWGGARNSPVFDIERAIQLADQVMRRRNVAMSDGLRTRFMDLHPSTTLGVQYAE